GEAGAAVAEDAALAIERDERRDRNRLVDRELRERHARVARPVSEGQVLQRALAALVADGAVERGGDEDELERRVLSFGGLRRGRTRLDHDSVRDGERARGLQLRHTLDLDEAHSARADGWPEPRLVAEDRNLDARRLCGLDEPGPLRHVDLAVVDRDGEELRHAPSRVVRASPTGRGSPRARIRRRTGSARGRWAPGTRRGPGRRPSARGS